MLFGHNSNVTVEGSVFHVQTEDRGAANALIDTTVYCRGRVLHRRTNGYFDLVPLDAERERTLKQRIDEQHLAVVEEIKSGALHLAPPPVPAAAAPATSKPRRAIALELVNAKNWLAGKRASLQVAARYADTGDEIPGAVVTARVDGSAQEEKFSTGVGTDGRALLEFDIPRLTGAEPVLVIEANYGEAHGQLRYQLRAKPKVPPAG